MLNDTIAAFVPIEASTNQRVKGIIAINKIINGIDLTIFTIKPIIKLITGLRPIANFPCLVNTRSN